MAQTTYSIPVNDPQRVITVVIGVFQHLVGWKREHNIDFVSVVRNGANMDITLSDPLPAAELRAIRMSLS